MPVTFQKAHPHVTLAVTKHANVRPLYSMAFFYCPQDAGQASGTATQPSRNLALPNQVAARCANDKTHFYRTLGCDIVRGRTMRFNLLKGVLPLSRAAALRDLLAGVTLASMDIPQVLGYARIAGMPAVTGLYTAFLPLLAFAIFGASRHLVVAADSATATIFASRLSTRAPASSAEYAALAGMVALLTAALLLIARIFKLGFLADFLSRTVLVGFLAGVGVQVGIAMLGDMFGVPGH